jgi:GAF domain-containing protein
MSATYQLSPEIEAIFNAELHPAQILENVLALIGKALQADRCFLYLRNPNKEKGKIVFCWCLNETIPDVREPEWKNDTQSLPKEDPLFAAALHAQPSIYIEDVETADPKIVNHEFEHKTFGHRALIHAHIIYDNQLWGILQPAIFGKPRQWSPTDHQLVEALLLRMVKPVVEYVKSIEM